MNKNNQKEIINISTLNKNINIEEKPKINEINKNSIINISEDKSEKNNFLNKLSLKKDNTNNLLNQKRERPKSNDNKDNNKETEEEINNNVEDKSQNTPNNTFLRKRTTLVEAKKEMKDFELLILNTEKEIEKKYGVVFPDLSFEDNLPNEIRNKFLDDFLESPKIKKILNEINSQK